MVNVRDIPPALLVAVAGLALLAGAVAAQGPSDTGQAPPWRAAPPTATPTATPTAIPTAIPPPASGITLLARGFGSPDDLAIDPRTGVIYFGDFSNGAVNQVSASGGIAEALVTGFKEPEGIAVTPDGDLIVVEQKDNQIWEVALPEGRKRLLRQLVNRTGQDGVDGIALDPATGEVLIPDSPNGRLLAMSRDGSTLRTIATGFVRPTGVVALPGGDYLVADEFGNTLYRVTPAGRKRAVSTMYQPDDVVLDAQGRAYVNSLGGNIYRVDLTTGDRTTLLSGLKLPHGLGIDAQGSIIIAEAGRNRVFRFIP
jgi:sugar lactone lactonase YvrE